MMETDDFIERLARSLEPVAPLQRPWLRATIWLIGAVVYISVLSLMMAPTGGTSNGIALRSLFTQLAAIGVSAAAAAAAFASVIPGRSIRALLWPAVQPIPRSSPSQSLSCRLCR
jgi:fatty acid desaturase